MASSQETNQSNKYTLQSLDKALKILDLFYQCSELGPGDIESMLAMNRSVAFRMLTTLSENGYLTKTDSGRYRLGVKLFSLGQMAYSHTELVSHAKPYLLKLTEAFGETSNLGVLSGNRSIVFLDKAIPRSPLRMETEIGSRYIAHLTASGKAILAFQPRDIILDYISKAELHQPTKNSAADTDTILKNLREVRSLGWGEDREECILGLTCFAAPILDINGRSVAAISVSGASTRMVANEDAIIRLIRETANAVSKMLW